MQYRQNNWTDKQVCILEYTVLCTVTVNINYHFENSMKMYKTISEIYIDIIQFCNCVLIKTGSSRPNNTLCTVDPSVLDFFIGLLSRTVHLLCHVLLLASL